MSIAFHLAVPVSNLDDTRKFYQGLLGCTIGRSGSNWVDINFFGHQLTALLKPSFVRPLLSDQYSPRKIPVHHFGAVLVWDEWHELKEKLEKSGVSFLVEPHQAFSGEVGEQMSMFLRDPSGYGIEFKAFEQPDRLFQAK